LVLFPFNRPVRAIKLGQPIAITDLCDDLTGSIVFAMLVNEVHANEVDGLAVVGFGHDCLTLNRNKTSILIREAP
jgi:hypothetical protein